MERPGRVSRASSTIYIIVTSSSEGKEMQTLMVEPFLPVPGVLGFSSDKNGKLSDVPDSGARRMSGSTQDARGLGQSIPTPDVFHGCIACLRGSGNLQKTVSPFPKHPANRIVKRGDLPQMQ